MKNQSERPQPANNLSNVTMLVVLDGFGHNDSAEHNAIAAANTPTWDRFWQQQPRTLIQGSGAAVGLPEDQMGNSEVGHMHLGAGRVVHQDFTRINKAVEDGEFASNSAFQRAFSHCQNHTSALHVFGLLSPGGVHSHEKHILALLDAAHSAGVEQVYLHAFLDGRDTPPRSASDSLAAATARFADLYHNPEKARVASICGRYWAMDRDQRWDRVQRAYDMLTRAEAPFQFTNAQDALAAAYERDENDEFVQPTLIVPADGQATPITSQDAVVFMNFRADRARQITRAFIDPDFTEFDRQATPLPSVFVSLTKYSDDLDTTRAFPPATLTNTFGEYLAKQNKRQLRIAETEKYAHVTFFFSGGQETPFAGEDRQLIPSPDVATYDLQPEMSAQQVTDQLTAAIRAGEHDAVVCNYANGDMVGHTGIMSAAIVAVETLDNCLAQLETALSEVGGQMLITADHGNVERMQDPSSGQAHTAHTSEPVPLVYVGPHAVQLSDGGTLADVAPTLLYLMGLPQPEEMTGRNLATIAQRRSA